MIYTKCPTCKTKLSNKVEVFEKEFEKICNINDLSEENKQKRVDKLFDDIEISKDRYCCRMRMLTYFNKVKYII